MIFPRLLERPLYAITWGFAVATFCVEVQGLRAGPARSCLCCPRTPSSRFSPFLRTAPPPWPPSEARSWRLWRTAAAGCFLQCRHDTEDTLVIVPTLLSWTARKSRTRRTCVHKRNTASLGQRKNRRRSGQGNGACNIYSHHQQQWEPRNILSTCHLRHPDLDSGTATSRPCECVGTDINGTTAFIEPVYQDQQDLRRGRGRTGRPTIYEPHGSRSHSSHRSRNCSQMRRQSVWVFILFMF